jgi:hypothetical protein
VSKIPKLVWNNWIKPLAVYAVLWAGFRYWLGIGDTQSVVFAFLFGSCYFGFKELNKKTEMVEEAKDFVPYRVSIGMHNPHDLLVKYKFAKSEEEWEQICHRMNETSIFLRDMNFTVLSLNKDGMPHLIWWDNRKQFLAGLPSFEEDIQGVEFPSDRRHFPNDKWSPRLYFGFRHGKGRSYKVALCVRETWWEKNKTEGIETDNDHRTGSVYLILAKLPFGELGLDYEARHEDRNTELEKLGWTIKDARNSDFSSIEVQNEYFSVSQRFLETD